MSSHPLSAEHPDPSTWRRAHLIGIGGTAMTPLATILLQMGVEVSGSDVTDVASLRPLEALGATIALGHRPENVGDVDIVVASSAVPQDNVEVCAARARGIPVVKHSAALGALMRPRRGIAIAGTHGKTTTTALTAVALDAAGFDATFHVGSEVVNYGLFGRLGRGDILVAEADEFDRRFLDYEPEIAVVTSLEPDHLDYFGDFAHVVAAFEAFLERLRPGGAALLCADDPVARSLPVRGAATITYGYADDADWRVTEWRPLGPGGGQFCLRSPAGPRHTFEIGLLGRHNAANAAAVVAVCARLGVPMDVIATGLRAFRGTRRRFEIVGGARAVTVVDDYAHHPTAIRATLEAARLHYRAAIWVVFQPHTAHRTISLFDDFRQCFAGANHVILAPTYRPPGREAEADDPTVADLAAAMSHPDVRALSAAEAAEAIIADAQPGDLVIVMGAGDIWTIEQPILRGLGTGDWGLGIRDQWPA